jgi:MFS family permease
MYVLNVLGHRSLALARWLTRPGSVQQRNVRNVLIDGIGVALVQGVATFLSVFLVRLGATPFMVGLLTSMPALTGMILAIPVGRLMERQSDILPWYSRVRVLVLGSYALTGLMPFFFPPNVTILAIIVIWAIATLPQTIVNVAFTMVMSAVAGPTQRYYLMSRRWSIMGVTTALTVALVGVILDAISFPLNYQVVFIASFAGGMLSYAFSNRIVLPQNTSPPVEHERHTLREQLRDGLTALRMNTEYNNFLISQFVFRCGLTLSIPLFPLYWVRELNAPDTWIGVINTVNSAVLMVAYFLWSKVSERRGNSMVLRACAFGLVFYPLLTGLTKTLAPLPIYAGFAGIFAAGIDLVMFDILLNTCPPKHAASYIALYQTTTYVATFLAPTLGTYLADSVGYGPALFVSAGLRLAGAVLFVLMGVGARRGDKETRRQGDNETNR